eukprot:3356360-Amphidinium_carterae.2
MAGTPSTATDGFAVVFEAQSGLTPGSGVSTMETDSSPLQQPRLKASSKAIPAPPQSTPRPTTANNPTSPPAQGPTGTAGQSGASTTPMEIDNEQPDETMGASAQSISSSSQISIAMTIVMYMESMMWETVV